MTFKSMILFVAVIFGITAVICAVGFFCVWLLVRHMQRFDDALEEALKKKGEEDENQNQNQ